MDGLCPDQYPGGVRAFLRPALGRNPAVFRWLGSLRRREELQPRYSAQMRRAWIAIGVAVSPLLIFVAKTGAGTHPWIQRPGLHDLATVLRTPGRRNVAFSRPSGGLRGCGIAPLRKRLLTRDQSWETWRCQFLLLWLLFPVGLTVLLSFARPVFLARYMIFCLPAFLVLVAAGLARFGIHGWLSVALIGCCFCRGRESSLSTLMTSTMNGTPPAQRPDFILDHTTAGRRGYLPHCSDPVAYEFFRSLRAGENTASPGFTAHSDQRFCSPTMDAGLDYRDFTGKPSADFLRAAPPAIHGCG